VGRKSRDNIICPYTKQFQSLIVCAASCDKKCAKYKEKITFDILNGYIEKHPDYKIIGELMVTKKTDVKEKKFWVIKADKTFVEVTEKEIMNNPKEYLEKQIWEKPPYRYEVVISLKRIKS